jgi:hypothetical protein
MIKTALAKLLTLKAAAILAAVSASGIAVASTTGVLPNPLGPDSPTPVHSTPDTKHPAGTPSPSLHGLCTAFLAGAGAEHGKALDSPAFTALITAAEDKDAVESFCTTLLATPPGAASTDHPTGRPTSYPTGPPTWHPTGKPGAHPTGAPTSLPTQTPSHPVP